MKERLVIKQILIAGVIMAAFWGGICMADTTDQKNVLGTTLLPHTGAQVTGFYRDGYCRTGPDDSGQHAIAATVTQKFLDYTKAHGNDLQTPRPEYGFKGLAPGDKWCLCTARWQEAEQAGVAPPVDLAATHATALMSVPLTTLRKYQVKPAN